MFAFRLEFVADADRLRTVRPTAMVDRSRDAVSRNFTFSLFPSTFRQGLRSSFLAMGADSLNAITLYEPGDNSPGEASFGPPDVAL